MQIEARIESFYSHLPQNVVKRHSKPEWLRIARFIEEKLAEDSYIIHSCETELSCLVVIDPANRTGLIRLTKLAILKYDPISPTLITLNAPLDGFEELNKLRDLNRFEEINKLREQIFFHGDIKPPSNILNLGQKSTLPIIDFGLSYNREEIESSMPYKIPKFVDPLYPVAPASTPQDPQ